VAADAAVDGLFARLGRSALVADLLDLAAMMRLPG